MRYFLAFLIWTSILVNPKPVQADPTISSYKQIGQAELLYSISKNETIEQPLITNALSNVEFVTLQLLKNPLFEKLPPFFILIDSHYQKSGGYFSPDMKKRDADNTEKHGILLSLANLSTPTQTKAVVTHELAHLLFSENHPHESSWETEGVALLIEWLITGFYRQNLSDAFKFPEITLTGDFDPKNESYLNQSHLSAQYSNVQLYFTYLYRLCQKNLFLSALIAPKPNDLPLIDSILSMNNCTVGRSFKESFKNFIVAKAKQDLTDPLTHVFDGTYTVPINNTPLSLEPYSMTVYRPLTAKRCKSDEIPWGEQRCIRLRFE